MVLVPDLDRLQAKFAPPARSALLDDDRRIIIVGARGWIGRTAVTLLHEAMGPAAFARRVHCFGSQAGPVSAGPLEVHQRALGDLATLDRRPTLLLHLAFLTMDSYATMDAGDYVNANRALSRSVFDALTQIGVDRLFVASSGAAAFADDAAADEGLRCYGLLKRDDETKFSAWAAEMPQERRVAIGRIYSLSGPYINKHETYALASFILDALAGRRIEVRAQMRVMRSYIAVRELLSLVFSCLLARDGDAVLRFDTGGEALELGEVAVAVADTLDGQVVRGAVQDMAANRYFGDGCGWSALLERHGIEPLALADQILETAAYLARQAAPKSTTV